VTSLYDSTDRLALTLDQPRPRRLLRAISMARLIAACAGFLILIQFGERPERYGPSRSAQLLRRCQPAGFICDPD
jgi:hypothetical protein